MRAEARARHVRADRAPLRPPGTLLARAPQWWRWTALRACRFRPGMTALDVVPERATWPSAWRGGRLARPRDRRRLLRADACPRAGEGARGSRARSPGGGDAQSLPCAMPAWMPSMAFVPATWAMWNGRSARWRAWSARAAPWSKRELPPRGVLLRAVQTYFHRILPRAAALLSNKDAYRTFQTPSPRSIPLKRSPRGWPAPAWRRSVFAS